jgi:uncharacterized membrane protein
MAAFSDHVFSIAATLLVLDLVVHPSGTPGRSNQRSKAPECLGYVIH